MPLVVMAASKNNSNSPQTLTIQCPVNVTITEGQKTDTSLTGFPKVLNNNGGTVTITYIDIFANGNCANGSDLISRNFTIRNSIGDIERCNQTIFIQHLKPDQIRVPPDTTIDYPKDKSLTEAILGFKNSLGSIDITFIDTKISNLCNIPVRIKRDWSIKNRCDNSVIRKSTNITLNVYRNSAEHKSSIIGDVCDNDGQIVLIPKGEFGPYTYQWQNGATTSSLFGIPAGNYSVIITDVFNCPHSFTFSVTSLAESADVGGRIATEKDYRVYPDSIYITDADNISKFCASLNGGLHFGFKLKSRKNGFMEYRFVKRSQVLDGVSTKDIVLIQRHILNKEILKDTLAYFAADVNRNNSVSSSDIAEIRKVILGIKQDFGNVYPWYFFRPDWKSVITKFNSYESIYFQGINITNYPRLNGDVLAVKMGDIDLSYRNNYSKLEQRSEESNYPLNINYTVETIGQDRIIHFYIDAKKKGLIGFQTELDLSKISSPVEVFNSDLPSDQYYLKDNKLSLSVSNGQLLEFSSDQPFISLKCSKKHLYLDNMISVSNRISSEYYDSEKNAHSLNIHFQGESKGSIAMVPNPFNEYLMISGDSYSSKLEIYNIQGIKIYQSDLNGTIRVSTQSWPAGIYFYKIVDEQYICRRGQLTKF